MATVGHYIFLHVTIRISIMLPTTAQELDQTSHIKRCCHKMSKYKGATVSRCTQNVYFKILNGGLIGIVAGGCDGEFNMDVRLAQLLDFIVNTTASRQYYIVYDDQGIARNVDLNMLMAIPFGSLGDTSIYEYESSNTLMEETIKSYYHTVEMRNFILLTGKENTLELFEHIRTNHLESPSCHWYLILEEDFSQDVLDVLNEGTQVSFLREDEDQFRLSHTYVNIDNIMSQNNVGVWSWRADRSTPHWFLSSPLAPNLREVYKDFGGRTVINCVLDNWPFFDVDFMSDVGDTLTDRDPQPAGGIDVGVLSSMAKTLNFSYTIIIAEDGQWGGVQSDGSITGMIGRVARHEADFAINEITITGHQRSQKIFFLKYYRRSKFLTLRENGPTHPLTSFNISFTQVWLTLFVSWLVIGPVLGFLTYLRRQFTDDIPKDWVLGKFTFNMFRSLVIFQGNQLEHESWMYRWIFVSWYFFTFIFFVLYSGTLTAVLAIPSFEKPIDSLWDLLEAVKNDGYFPITTFGTSNEFIFKVMMLKAFMTKLEATFGIYKDIWDVFDPSVGYVYTWDEGVERVLEGKYTYLNAQLGALIRANKRGMYQYHFAKEPFYPQSYAIACRQGSPYKDVFNRLLMELVGAGLIDKWTNDEIDKVRTSDQASNTGPAAMTIEHLQAAFFVLIIGVVVAAIILLVE
ncbi:unnamed protein product, partial [Meganyctiphanes norvegica]